MRQRARLRSSGGKYGSQWLHIPVTTKGSQMGTIDHQLPREPLRHSTATQDGLNLKERLQGNRKCRCKVRGSKMGDARWDPHRIHLAAGCAWGGWRTKWHDDIATMIVEWTKEPWAHTYQGESPGTMARCMWRIWALYQQTHKGQGGTTPHDVAVLGLSHKYGYKGATATRLKTRCGTHPPGVRSDRGGWKRSQRVREIPKTCVWNQSVADQQRIGCGGIQRRVGVPHADLNHPPTRNG